MKSSKRREESERLRDHSLIGRSRSRLCICVQSENRWVAILKYIKMEQVSTRVVIRGAAMMAGSRPIFFASRGRQQPAIFARMMVAMRESPISTAILRLWYMSMIRSPLTAASTKPTRTATRNSLNKL